MFSTNQLLILLHIDLLDVMLNENFVVNFM